MKYEVRYIDCPYVFYPVITQTQADYYEENEIRFYGWSMQSQAVFKDTVALWKIKSLKPSDDMVRD